MGSSNYNLNFPIHAGDPSPLNNIAKAAQEIAKQTKLSSTEWGVAKSAMESALGTGARMGNVLGTLRNKWGDVSPRLAEFTKLLQQNVKEQERAASAAEQTAARSTRAIQKHLDDSKRILASAPTPRYLGPGGDPSRALKIDPEFERQLIRERGSALKKLGGGAAVGATAALDVKALVAVPPILSEIAAKAKLTAQQTDGVISSFRNMAAAGQPVNQALKNVAASMLQVPGPMGAFGAQLKERITLEEKAAIAVEKAAQRRIQAMERERAAQARAFARGANPEQAFGRMYDAAAAEDAARTAARAAEIQRAGKMIDAALKEDAARTARRIAEEEALKKSGFRNAIYGAQIAGGISGIPLPGGLARHGGNLLNIVGSPAGMAVGGAVAGIGLGIGAAALVKEQADAARETVNLSRELGVTISQARLYENVAKLTGVSVGAFTTGERMLSQALEDQTGRGKNAAEALQRIGISLVDTQGSVRESGTVFTELLQKIAAIPSQTERAREAVNIFGRGAITSILPLVENFRAASEELKKYGLNVDESLIGKTSQAATQFAALGIAWDNLKLKLASKVEPIVIPVIGMVTSVVANPLDPYGVNSAAVGRYADQQGIDPTGLKGTGYKPGDSERIKSHFTQGASSRYDRFLTGQGDQEAILSDRVSKAKKEYEDEVTKAKNFAGPDVSDAAKAKEIVEVNKLRGAYEGLNQQLTNLRDNKRQLEKNQTDLQSFIDRLEAKDLDPVSAIMAERDKVVSQRGMNHGQVATANYKADIAITGALDKMRASPEYRFVEPYAGRQRAPESAAEAQALIGGMHPDTTAKDVEDGLKRHSESLARNVRDANSLQATVRNIQEESAKRQSETDTRLQASLATSGMTGAQRITTEGAFDIQGAARSRDEQIATLGPAIDKLKPLIDYTADDFKKIEASAKIVAEFKEKEGQIAARTLIDLDQERQRQVDSRSSTFAHGILAAAQGHGQEFGRGLGQNISETILTNFGKNFIFQKGGPAEKAIPTLDSSSTIGKLLAGVLPGRGVDSPLNAPALKLDTAGEKLSAAADKLQGIPASSAPTTTGAGFGVGIPGLSTFGSSTNGPNRIFSAVKSLFGGNKYTGAQASAAGANPISPGASKSIEADAAATALNTTATNNLTAAVIAQTKATEYVASGGAAGEMPTGATPPVVTGPTGIPGLGTFGSDTNGLSGSSAAGGIGAFLAAAPILGTGITAAVKAVFGGNQGGSAGGGGSNGNGAGIIVQQVAPLAKGISDLSKTIQSQTRATEYVATGGGAGELSGGSTPPLTPSLATFGSDTNSLPFGQANSRLTQDLTGLYSGNVQQSGFAGVVGTAQKAIGGFGALMANPFGDKGGTPGINGQPGTDQGHFSAMGVAAAGADIAVGAMTAVSEFKKGGARGALGGASAILGTAAALDPEPISKAVLGIAALGTSLVKSMLGDPKVQRQNQIAKNLFLDQYQAPEALNVTSSTRGTFADIGRDGNIRTSSLSPYPRVTAPYLDLPYRFNVPGTQTSQFGGGGPIVIHNHISAMDAGSFEGFLKNNPNALMEGFAHGMTFGHSRATQTIKGAIGQG